ncbi:MAG: WD40/YVTN/BNR-like repeat-containing protein [Thermoanaerobaculia bacterium]
MNPRRLVPSLVLVLVSAAASAAPIPPESFSDLHWRSIGPLRAGWATAADGIPGTDTFYMGVADGGVWRTDDAGRTWTSLFDRQAEAAVGSLEVVPGNPAILYVGTGQVTTRWDVTQGNGVYRSGDGGRTWEHRGLADSRHIGKLLVDPRNPDVVLAAALGHYFAPGGERGIYRTADGGATWERVLFVDDRTGAVDLAADPAAPDVVFASFWQVRGYPWQSYFTPNIGPGSGIWKSTDGGKTWARLENGLPEGPLGRIGLAVAPGSRGARVYATIDAGPAPGLYRSDDAGANWQLVNPDGNLAAAYFATLAVDPKDADTVYIMGQSIRRSRDGGKTVELFRGAPGGDDYHFLWIDPEHPERMITGADQGAVVTVNGGRSWSSWYNQPTGQFYHLATDDRFPYRIYSGQQDSGSIAAASRSDYGQLTFRDWQPAGADERDYVIPFPGNPDIVYGSGLGGRVSRWDAKTGQVQNVSPWPVSSYGRRPTTVRYRTTWIQPLAISQAAPHAIYASAQVLFRSLDGGATWQVISPDLTGALPEKGTGTKDCEGDVPVERARACGYGIISTIAPSPLDKDLVWVGADSGVIHVTRDGGKSWQDVTPRGLPDWSRVAQIDASPIDPGSAFAAIDRHRADDDRPYVYVTHDFGKSWQLSRTALPDGSHVNVVRQDLVRPELLFAGTRTGVHVSFDGGGSWQPLQLDLPTSGVNDLTVHGNDLVAGTEGRAIWVLDDISPLRHLKGETGAVLLPPAIAYRVSANQNRDTPLPLDEPRSANPPAGAVIDYLLPAGTRGPVVLEIVDSSLDGKGKVVRSFRSDQTPERPEANQYFADDWLQPLAPLPARAGHNRFAWNLRLERPKAPEYDYSIAAVPGADTAVLPQGLMAAPGKYEVRLTVDGRTLTQPLELLMDPRVDSTPADVEAQHAFYREVAEALERGSAGLEKAPKDVKKEVKEELEAALGALTALATDVEGVDRRPTAAQREVLDTYRKRLDEALKGVKPSGSS